MLQIQMFKQNIQQKFELRSPFKEI